MKWYPYIKWDDVNDMELASTLALAATSDPLLADDVRSEMSRREAARSFRDDRIAAALAKMEDS